MTLIIELPDELATEVTSSAQRMGWTVDEVVRDALYARLQGATVADGDNHNLITGSLLDDLAPILNKAAKIKSQPPENGPVWSEREGFE